MIFFFFPCCFNLAKTVFLNSLPCVVQVRVGCKGILHETEKAGAPLSPKGLRGPGYWQRMRMRALTLCWLPGWAWRSNGAAAAPDVAHTFCNSSSSGLGAMYGWWKKRLASSKPCVGFPCETCLSGDSASPSKTSSTISLCSQNPVLAGFRATHKGKQNYYPENKLAKLLPIRQNEYKVFLPYMEIPRNVC